MSFRVRVLVLVTLVAVTATAATAWLVLSQARQQVAESAAADRQVVETIAGELSTYGRQHATWENVAELVARLSQSTGQRIRLETAADAGVVVADSDTLEGRSARPVDSLPRQIDVRPLLSLPSDAQHRIDITLSEIDEYRRGSRLAACLTRSGVPVQASAGPNGVVQYRSEAPDAEPVRYCQDVAISAAIELQLDRDTVQQCRETDTVCLQQAFQDRTNSVAPVPLTLYIGAVDEPPALTLTPVLMVAGVVAAFAIVGTALLSRRVLRPIGALTQASRRLGEGDLGERVPVLGRDELSELARSFNRMADSLQQAEERQRRLVADVAHELRTPLANLRGYLEALKDGVIEPDGELFTSLHEEAVLQQRIVDDLQDLALAEAGRLAYHLTRVDLVELLESSRAAHQAVAQAAGLEIEVAAAGPVYVRADPDRLRQVFGNLITNAIRAGGSVRLSARASGAVATVDVADTGSGIPADDLPFVFDRFWRADAARQRSTGGSGLGLAITRQIVNDHNGHIRVTSTVGEGTTFTITLPLHR